MVEHEDEDPHADGQIHDNAVIHVEGDTELLGDDAGELGVHALDVLLPDLDVRHQIVEGVGKGTLLGVLSKPRPQTSQRLTSQGDARTVDGLERLALQTEHELTSVVVATQAGACVRGILAPIRLQVNVGDHKWRAIVGGYWNSTWERISSTTSSRGLVASINTAPNLV